MSKINDLLAEEGVAADNYEVLDELPEQVESGRPTVV
jgi:hypothetical protein